MSFPHHLFSMFSWQIASEAFQPWVHPNELKSMSGEPRKPSWGMWFGAMLTTERIFVEDLEPNNQTKHVENAVIILVFLWNGNYFFGDTSGFFVPEPWLIMRGRASGDARLVQQKFPCEAHILQIKWQLEVSNFHRCNNSELLCLGGRKAVTPRRCLLCRLFDSKTNAN